MKLKALVLLTLLVGTQPLLAQASSKKAGTCPLAMVVFVGGGVADSSNPNVLKIRDSLESKFGYNYPITVVSDPTELMDFDYSLSLSLDKANSVITVNVRDVLLDKILRTEAVSWSQGTVDQVLNELGSKLYSSTIKRGLVGNCQ